MQEFALGGDLYAQLAQAGGYLAEDQVACEVMVPVLAALGYMHDKVTLYFQPIDSASLFRFSSPIQLDSFSSGFLHRA